MADDELDGAAVLIGLGLLALVGVGMYKVLKSIVEYEENEIINKQQAVQLASTYTSNYTSSLNCRIHPDGGICMRQGCYDCLECKGIGDDVARWCKPCQEAWEADEDYWAANDD